MLRSIVAVLVLGVAGSAAQAQSQMERGRYLVEAVLACDGCHTPRGPGGLDMTRRFAGGYQVWDEPAYTVRGSNISQDAATGIGKWSEADLKRLLIDGKRPSGVPVAPQMPFAFYKVMTPGDLDAVVAYVRSVPAVRNEVPAPIYKQETHAHLLPGGEKPFTDADLKDKVKRGFYLASLAHCMECHARAPDGTTDFKGRWGKGGHEMTGPYGKVTVSNITSHPTKGIGAWSDADIRKALLQGIGRDGRTFKPPMARFVYYKNMTEDDVEALIAWVRTIPPLE